jgi:hypothetical protein
MAEVPKILVGEDGVLRAPAGYGFVFEQLAGRSDSCGYPLMGARLAPLIECGETVTTGLMADGSGAGGYWPNPIWVPPL